MQQLVAETHLRFEGMTEGMAEIEQGALSAFAFVGGDDFGFHFHTSGNGFQQCFGFK